MTFINSIDIYRWSRRIGPMTTGDTAHRRYDRGTEAPLGRICREVSAWLGILLLSVQVLAAAAMPARSAEDGPAPFAQDILGDRIVICTPSGLVVLDRSGTPVVPSDGNGHQDLCVFCLPLMHAGAELPILPAAVVPMAAGSSPAAAPAASPIVRSCRLAGAATPRAPPRA